MKKSTILVFFSYALTTILFITFVILRTLDLDIIALSKDLFLLRRLLFSVLSVTFSMTILLLVLWAFLDEISKRHLNYNLRRILDDKPVRHLGESDIGQNLVRLSNKMQHLTSNLQNTENAYIQNTEDIVKQERRRIARDLHDTVSQELFASSMMVSGLSQSLEFIEPSQLKDQLETVEGMLNSAQNDLRVMLLHLRPIELQDRTLKEGLKMILQELMDKTTIEVIFRDSSCQLPKLIEDNLFRVAQEFISNTLKHANASRLEVYLTQSDSQIQLKMVDDGQGFDVDTVRSLSYGLKNIEDRVEDMAGKVQILSAKGAGVTMTVSLPLTYVEDDSDNDNN
ncbi:sensor histidine kinase [Streptococcus fryi]